MKVCHLLSLCPLCGFLTSFCMCVWICTICLWPLLESGSWYMWYFFPFSASSSLYVPLCLYVRVPVCACSLVVKPEVGSLVSVLTAHSSQEKSSSRVKFRRKVERRENYCKEVRSGNDTSATMSDVSPHTATHPKRKTKSEFDHSASPGYKSVNRRVTGNPPFLPFPQWNLIF